MSGFSLGLGLGLGRGVVSGGVVPTPGYVFLLGKNPDGSYTALTVLNADTSRSNLQGKAA